MAEFMALLGAAAGAAAGGGEVDPNFNQTVLLLHGDGTNGAQNNTFLDSSTNNFTITRNGNTTQGTFSPFSAPDGRWSNYFDGTGDYLSVADNAAFDFGSGDFTTECWFNLSGLPSASGAYTFASQWRSTTSTSLAWFFYLFNNAGTYQLYLSYSTSGTNQVNLSVNLASAPIVGTWNHVAFVRSGTNFLIFLNGSQVGTTQTLNATIFNSTAPVWICAQNASGTPDYLFNGYISNLRVVKGTAVYTSNFTPPTTPLTAITNTSLLTCQSNRFVDNSTNNFAITRNGDVKVTPFSPFAPAAAYSASVNGGSGYFDGTGDYLITTSAAALAIGTSAFTLEGWCYFNNVNTSGAGFGTCAVSVDASGDRGVSLFLTGSGAWRFRVGRSVAGQFEDFLGTTTLVAGQWYYFKIVRTSTGSNDTRVYLNGVQEAIGTSTISLNMQKFSVGTYSPSDTATALLNGYAAGIRFTNTAESSAVPTAPPTAVSGTQYLANFTNAGIFDNTGKNNLETVGNAQIDTTVKKYGTGSMEFDGTDDYLVGVLTPDLNLGTGDFTLELWIYPTTLNATDRMVAYTGNFGIGFYISSSAIKLTRPGNVLLQTISTSLSANTWQHIAISRSGTSLRTFVNGTQVGSTLTNSSSFNPTTRLEIGRESAGGNTNAYIGFIDDLRITKGVARYTANFTPPIKEFPNL